MNPVSKAGFIEMAVIFFNEALEILYVVQRFRFLQISGGVVHVKLSQKQVDSFYKTVIPLLSWLKKSGKQFS